MNGFLLHIAIELSGANEDGIGTADCNMKQNPFILLRKHEEELTVPEAKSGFWNLVQALWIDRKWR
jgi:hypothetical protein